MFSDTEWKPMLINLVSCLGCLTWTWRQWGRWKEAPSWFLWPGTKDSGRRVPRVDLKNKAKGSRTEKKKSVKTMVAKKSYRGSQDLQNWWCRRESRLSDPAVVFFFFCKVSFIRKTDVEAETAILWPPDVKSWLIWKDPDIGKDWRQEEKAITEDEMVVWHHRLNGHEFG